ncbi:hypothetical protein SMSP2_00611 [Limihaloglobus sulfuriphilus]|uniref:Type II secretion system protein GspC N-terminal domain-containing protein n=1 Tax=Limihaloglobus sulfuriphilus TaxID=1851148 RepID=A0A1Q2MD78_9BACT|nr:hypothetical protein [Limihaloglobus sulfuriphilus]AQQ70267.1 hypothetical protein SMSP2_00611 [Limihaloglobus sulfuriphilus]
MLNLLKICTYILVPAAVVIAGKIAMDSVSVSTGYEDVLSAPTASETAQQSIGSQSDDEDSTEHALITAAMALAQKINPPIEKSGTVVSRTGGPDSGQKPEPPTPKPPVVYTKFKLLGTCVNHTNPARSIAYIDVPGKGKQWVYKGEDVNHSVIKDIMAGSILVDQGGSVTELFVPQAAPNPLLKTAGSVGQSRESELTAQVQPGSAEAAAYAQAQAEEARQQASVTEDEQERREELVEKATNRRGVSYTVEKSSQVHRIIRPASTSRTVSAPANTPRGPTDPAEAAANAKKLLSVMESNPALNSSANKENMEKLLSVLESMSEEKNDASEAASDK